MSSWGEILQQISDFYPERSRSGPEKHGDELVLLALYARSQSLIQGPRQPKPRGHAVQPLSRALHEIVVLRAVFVII